MLGNLAKLVFLSILSFIFFCKIAQFIFCVSFSSERKFERIEMIYFPENPSLNPENIKKLIASYGYMLCPRNIS